MHISVPSFNSAVIGTLFSADGKLVWKGILVSGVNTINAQGFNNGIYYFKAIDANAVISTQKVIISH